MSGGRKITLDASDTRAGWERISLGTGPDYEDATAEQLLDLEGLWCDFIERLGGVYTIEAFYVMWFTHGHGTDKQWSEWAQGFIDAGIEDWLRAYWAGVPPEDIVGR